MYVCVCVCDVKKREQKVREISTITMFEYKQTGLIVVFTLYIVRVTVVYTVNVLCI